MTICFCLGGAFFGIAQAYLRRLRSVNLGARPSRTTRKQLAERGYPDGTFGGGIVDRQGRRLVLFPDTHSWRIERGELCVVGEDLIWACDRARLEGDRIGLTECRSGTGGTIWFEAVDVDGWECLGDWCSWVATHEPPRVVPDRGYHCSRWTSPSTTTPHPNGSTE